MIVIRLAWFIVCIRIVERQLHRRGARRVKVERLVELFIHMM